MSVTKNPKPKNVCYIADSKIGDCLLRVWTAL